MLLRLLLSSRRRSPSAIYAVEGRSHEAAEHVIGFGAKERPGRS